MKRRKFTMISALGLTLGIPGCADEHSGDTDDEEAGTSTSTAENWSPVIHGDEPEVSPGEEIQLTVEAEYIAALRLFSLPDDDYFYFAVNESQLSPSPTGQYDSYPPIWQWSPETDVTVKIQVQIAAETPHGEYKYYVDVYNKRKVPEADSVTEQFDISVV